MKQISLAKFEHSKRARLTDPTIPNHPKYGSFVHDTSTNPYDTTKKSISIYKDGIELNTTNTTHLESNVQKFLNANRKKAGSPTSKTVSATNDFSTTYNTHTTSIESDSKSTSESHSLSNTNSSSTLTTSTSDGDNETNINSYDIDTTCSCTQTQTQTHTFNIE